jgi:hypothetical protein
MLIAILPGVACGGGVAKSALRVCFFGEAIACAMGRYQEIRMCYALRIIIIIIIIITALQSVTEA